MLRQLLRHRPLLLLFVIGLLLEVAYAVAAPLSLKYLVDEAFTPKNAEAFYLILAVLLGGGLLSIAAGTSGDYALSKLSGRIIEQLRTDLYVHVQKQSLPFFQRYRVGDLVSRFSSDMASIERVVSFAFPFFLKETLSVLLGLVMLFMLEWKLTLVMLAGSVLLFAGPKLLQSRAESANLSYKEAQERFSNLIDETVKGHKTVKAYHRQSLLLERARRQIQTLLSLGLRMHWTNSLLERLPLTVLLVLNGVMIGFGGYLIFQDSLTVGGFMAFFTLFMATGQAASNLTMFIPSLIDSGISFRRIGEVLSRSPDVPEADSPAELAPLADGIRLRDVSFGYTEDSDQLREVSLDIPAGSYAAFVGPSGSGKSTALQLLARFYDPREGAVTFDGLDLREVSEASLRMHSAIVTQDSFLFNTTIRDNLLFGSVDAEESAMIEAASLAMIHDSIAGWPDGYDTPVHNEGASLSGGQRQRISIARALLKRPSLLLLDEVTSALDPATEADLNRSLLQLRGNRTLVSVTHRLASVVHADRIFVFRDGRIVESGPHEELLRQGGLYREMWDKQHGFALSQDGLHASVDEGRLAQLPFFGGIEPERLRDVAGLFATETFKEGDAAVKEGDPGDKFYIIVRGKFEITKQTPEQGELRVAVLQDGDHFGEIALLKDIPRTATVRALVPSVIISMRREAFLALTSQYPSMLEAVEHTLRQRQ
jgi:ATP-binding cassette subfamily B protein